MLNIVSPADLFTCIGANMFAVDDQQAVDKTGADIPDVRARKWELCSYLARKPPATEKGAKENSDNYRIFATAMFIEGRFWHRGRASKDRTGAS